MFKLFTLIPIILAISTSKVFAAKTFVYCSEGSPSTFNPQIATDGPTFNASSKPVYNTLVQFKSGTTEIQPALAESWKVSKDGKEYTFKLRKNVSFHKTDIFNPTRNFNADDVLFTFNRQRQKDHPFHKSSSGGTYEYFDSMEMGKIISDIKKVDDYTVQFILSKQEAPFLANLAMDFASILSFEYAKKMKDANTLDKLETNPVGTGPFVFQSYQKDTIIRYKANDKYFFGKPKIDNLIFSITPDASVRFQKLKKDECQLIAEPAPADLEAMKSNTQLQVMEQAGLNVGYLAMNTEREVFKKKEVRQAINMALNKKSYLDAIYLNRAASAKNPIPPTIWSYNNSNKEYEFNPEKARELLKKAGYPNGFETDLWTLPVSRPYNPSGKKMGEMMQSDLARIGIKVKLVTYDWPTYLKKSKDGEHSMVQLGWTGDNGDPDNFLNVLLGCGSIQAGSNLARWCHKPYDDLVQQARGVVEQKKRADLYSRAQTIFIEEAPWVPLAYARVYRAMSKKVSGYKIQPLGSERFDELDIK